jgi:hypothetical protein
MKTILSGVLTCERSRGRRMVGVSTPDRIVFTIGYARRDSIRESAVRRLTSEGRPLVVCSTTEHRPVRCPFWNARPPFWRDLARK